MDFHASIPGNTKHNFLRRWAAVVQMLYKCFVFIGMAFGFIITLSMIIMVMECQFTIYRVPGLVQ